MRMGNVITEVPSYEDHLGLWADELSRWVPDVIFDAHVHLGPPEVMGAFSPDRLKDPLCTFGGLSWEEAQALYARLFSGKRLGGLIAFPLPMREVELDAANAYIRRLMKQDPRLRGFLLSHPTDVERTRAGFESALAEGVRFSGVKPYYDLLGRSNYEVAMKEFIPEDLLRFMNAEGLIMMLHSSGRGMGEPRNQDYVRSVLSRYPNVRIILAHMGRYLDVEDFFRFSESDVFNHPNLYFEMSSASRKEVYVKILENATSCDCLLFGTDLPFGMIAGVEAWSEETGPVYLTREHYEWSDARAMQFFADDARQLTYNTYHVIDSFKEALEGAGIDAAGVAAIKKKVFHDNASSLFGDN